MNNTLKEMNREFKKILIESQRNGRTLRFDESDFNNFLLNNRFQKGDVVYRNFYSNGDYKIGNLNIFREGEKYIHFDKKIFVKWGAGEFEVSFAEPMESTKSFKFVLVGKYTVSKEISWNGQLSSISYFNLTRL